MNFEHVDRASVKKLVNIQELKDGHFEIKQVQFEHAQKRLDYDCWAQDHGRRPKTAHSYLGCDRIG